jgi:hypothetical protein
MPIVAGSISREEFQSHRTRESGKSKYDDFLSHVLNMDEGSGVSFSHTFTNDAGEEVTAEHSEKGSCPISTHIMNQRGRLKLRKGMFRSSHNPENGNLEIWKTIPSEVKGSAAEMTDDEADAAREDGTA